MSVVRRWGVWAASLLVIFTALVVGAARPGAPSLAARSQQLAEQVRCPVCQGESAAQSQTPAAVAIRAQISAELGAGLPAATVLSDLERSYGVSILEKPPASGVSLVVWVLPGVVGVAAAAGLGVAFARWRRSVRAPLVAAPAGGPPSDGGA
ncbi:MAG TPA: cytochrome c-type biogenesis protein CcmH [Acidimicrobiales bacterium]|nr:cytochrome c-type biogenesis protein CcmH [Acidimicrobiales bacterium]